MSTQQSAVIAKPDLVLRVDKQEFKIPENAGKLLLTKTQQGFQMEEIATLGESNVFVRRDASGELSLIYKTVRLAHDRKEIDRLGSRDDSPWVITVPGYNKLNQIAGVYIATPQSIIVDGKECANPHIHYENGEIKRIIARKIAIGYSPIGNLVAVDTVRYYNFDAYYLQDLHNKAKYKPNAAKFGTVFVCPFAPDAEVQEKNGGSYVKDKGKVYIFKVIKDFEGVWIDPSNDEIREVYSQHIQHQKFGDVIAQSLAQRNALKAHPAIATAQVKVSNGVAEVTVFGWKHGRSSEQLQTMAEKIVKGEKPEGVEVQQNIEEATYEEIEQAAATEVDDDTPAASSPSAPVNEKALFDKKGDATQEQKSVQQEQQTESVPEKIKKIATEKGIDLNMFCKNMFDSRFDNLTPEQYAKLLGVMEKVTSGRKEGN